MDDQQGNALLEWTVDPDEVVGDWESQDPQYEWDEVADKEETPLYRACEGDTEMRPLVYEDTLRQGRAEQM